MIRKYLFALPKGREKYIVGQHSIHPFFFFPNYLFSFWAPSRTVELLVKSFDYEYALANSSKKPNLYLISRVGIDKKSVCNFALQYREYVKTLTGQLIGLYRELLELSRKFVTEHFFIRWFIPLWILTFSLVSPMVTEIMAALYLMLGRSKIFEWVEKDMKMKIKKLENGLEKFLREGKTYQLGSEEFEELEKILDEGGSREAWKWLERRGVDEDMIKFYWTLFLEKELKRLYEGPFISLARLSNEVLVVRNKSKKRFETRRIRGKSRVLYKRDTTIFDSKISLKELMSISSYKDLYDFIKISIKKGGIDVEEIPIFEMGEGTQTCFALGNKKGKYKVVVATGHEDEHAGSYAIAQMIRSLVSYKGLYTEEILDKVRLYFVPVDDPIGYNRFAWTAIDLNSEIYRLPRDLIRGAFLEAAAREGVKINEFLANLLMDFNPFTLHIKGKVIRDENGVWGSEVSADFILAQQDFLKDISPIDVFVDLHETTGYRDRLSEFVYGDSGILLIVESPLIDINFEKLYKITRKTPLFSPENFLPSSFMYRKIKKLFGKMKFYQVCNEIIDYMDFKSIKRLRGEQQKLLEAPSIYPFLIPLGRAMATDGPLLRDARIVLRSGWAIRNAGAWLSITTETFPQSLDNEFGLYERIIQDIGFLEGLLLALKKRV